MTKPARWCRPFIAGVLAVHAVLLLVIARVNFVTLDEASYIPAGLSHWQTGNFELYRVNPPLPRLLATLPLLPFAPNTDLGPLPRHPGARPEWEAGPRFADANAERYLDLLWLARLAGVGWSVLGGWVVWRWGRDLYGAEAGLLALALWCFSPDVLAHAPLVTSDLPATVAGLAACYVFWHYLREPSWALAWFAGLLLGVALLTKFTWLILFGLWPAVALLLLAGRPLSLRLAGARTLQVTAVLGLGLLVLNLGYAFTDTGRPLGDFPFVSRLLAGDEREPGTGWGNRFRESGLGRVPVPLPADLVLGLDAQRCDFESGWPFYLAGTWQTGGWWYFYLYSLAVKVPLGTWGLLLGALLTMAWRGPTAGWRDEVFLWSLPLILVAVASSQTGLNYHRYVLPALPFLLIAVGRLGLFLRWTSWKRGLAVLALAIWSIGSSLAVFPHSLSYFNEAAGGPENGPKHLVDSNIDWGQDLLFLRDWLRDHPEVTDLQLAYFNHVDPRVVGLAFELPPLAGDEEGLQPGYYAVSVHFIQGGTFTAPDGTGEWRMVPQEGYGYFRHLVPVGRAGYSIWIYRVPALRTSSSELP